MTQNRRSLQESIVRLDSPVCPDVEDHFVKVSHLAETGRPDFILHAGNRREDRINRNHADGSALAFIFIASLEPPAHLNLDLGIEFHLFIEGADDLVLIDDFVDIIFLDVAGGNYALFFDLEAEDAGLFLMGLKLSPSSGLRRCQ